MNDDDLRKGFVEAIRRAVTVLPEDVVAAIAHARERESEYSARSQLDMMVENVEIAREKSVPICQDTGVLVFYIEGDFSNPLLTRLPTIISDAVAEATVSVPLRPNAVHPFDGVNTGNNLGRFMPQINWTPSDTGRVVVRLQVKGAGSENCSALAMLSPISGLRGVKRFVLDHVAGCAGRPCPPGIIAVGLGGGSDMAMSLAKRALLRSIGERHIEDAVAEFELQLLGLINAIGIGPMGVGGETTCLDVHVDYAHRHTASLPVAIAYQCWADRRATVTIDADGTVEVV